MEDFSTMAHRAFMKAINGEDVTSFPGGFCVRIDEDEAELPQPFSIIYDGDLTAVTWDDGTVTRTHRQDTDEHDPLLGTLNCIVRKLTDNEGHGVDLFEQTMTDVAKYVQSEDDLDEVIEAYEIALDTLCVLRSSKSKWLPQLGKDEPEEPSPTFRVEDSAVTTGHVVSDRTTELEQRIDHLTREREAMRQKVRDLIDAGELT